MRPETLGRYLDTLSGQLPGPVVEELADGLEQTWRRYLCLGLAPEEAAAAAVAEFGAPHVIVAEFARAHPGCRAARRLLAAGSIVGLCWAAALVMGRGWNGPVQVEAGNRR